MTFPRDYPWMDPSCPACTNTLTAGEETSHRIEHGHGCDCRWLCTKNRLAEYDWFKTFNMPDERIAHRLGITTDALGIMLRRRARND